jgi:3-carboxy-cis,cis-muconate cycloisomerase
MTDLLWPGDERAGELMGAPALLRALAAVESAWLDALVAAGVAPSGARLIADTVTDADVPELAGGAESAGNPVPGLVRLLRDRLPEPAATWVHRGLTSQDVLDTALALCLRDVHSRLVTELRAQAGALVRLVAAHGDTLMTGRTLTQPAVPISFADKAARWLTAVLDAADGVTSVLVPAQFGGAAGTLAAPAELLRLAGADVSTQALVESAAQALGLPAVLPWHTTRSPVTRCGDALVSCTDAFGRIAEDVLTLSRPELGELAEPAGRGGSSTMPHKANPVLSVLIRRAALTAPGLSATLHLTAAQSRDERADGAWHAEWATLATLARRTVVAAAQTSELLGGLRVDADAMRHNAERFRAELSAERSAITALFDHAPGGDYLGASGAIVAAVLARADDFLGRQP